LNNRVGRKTNQKKGDVSSVIIEGILSWWFRPGTTEFFQALEKLCAAYDVVMILD
jgi:acetylornithine aminotransferase